MKRTSFLTAAVLIAFGAAPAWGDATFESFFKTSGVGGMGAAESTSVKRIQGDKKSETSQMRFTGAILSRLAPGGGDGHDHASGQGSRLDARPQDEDVQGESPRAAQVQGGEDR